MSFREFLDGRVTLYPGDCRTVLATLPEASVDSVVCDPPYHLTSIVKRFGGENAAPAKVGKTGAYARASAGFMGKQWDGGDVAFQVETWAAVFRVLKPGGHLVAFSGTRTYHRMVCAIEDAGFEIRDQIGYCFGSGFPKSHNITKTANGCECEGQKVPDSVLQRDLRSVLGTDVSPAAYDSQGSRSLLLSGVPEQGAPTPVLQCSAAPARASEQSLEGRGDVPQEKGKLRKRAIREVSTGSPLHGPTGRIRDGASTSDGALDRSSTTEGGVRPPQGSQSVEQRAEQSGAVAGQPDAQALGAWPLCGRCGKPIFTGLGTALKPAWEPIALARKPLDGTVAENVLSHGTGALNIDAARVPFVDGNDLAAAAAMRASADQNAGRKVYGNFENGPSSIDPYLANMQKGRWPANIVHDGSPEVLEAFPESKDGVAGARTGQNGEVLKSGLGPQEVWGGFHGEGSAARFFYTAKADADDRLGSKHPTVKPLDLMQWLVRLVTPRNGTCLDPFAGTGTTGEAAWREGMRAILIEREPEYIADIERRMELADNPTKRAAVAKTKNNLEKPENLPLFSGLRAAE